MQQNLKILAPAILLIIAVAVGGAYVLNKKNSANTETAQLSSQASDQGEAQAESSPSVEQIIAEVEAEADSENTETDAEIEKTVSAETAADDSIINAAGNENYETKF